MPLDASIVRELQETMARLGLYHGPISGDFDEATHASCWLLERRENLEDRHSDGGMIDKVALQYFRQAFGR